MAWNKLDMTIVFHPEKLLVFTTNSLLSSTMDSKEREPVHKMCIPHTIDISYMRRIKVKQEEDTNIKIILL